MQGRDCLATIITRNNRSKQNARVLRENDIIKVIFKSEQQKKKKDVCS